MILGKQAPRQWYRKFESVMQQQGYKKTTFDHCVFVQRFSHDDFTILLLYVDDMHIVGQTASRIAKLKQGLSQVFCYERLRTSKANSWYKNFVRQESKKTLAIIGKVH